jgi:hypothetical protein
MKRKTLQFTLAGMLVLSAGQAWATSYVLDTFTWGDSRYYLTSSTASGGFLATEGGLSWTDAELGAVALGGHLATINSQAEQDAIWNRWADNSWPSNPASLWIGLTDKDQEGVYKWISGEAGTYFNWAPGEPNNLVNGNEDYVYMGGQYAATGKWNDYIDSPTHSTPAQRIYGVVEVKGVPDGGGSLTLLGCSLAGLLALRSHRFMVSA